MNYAEQHDFLTGLPNRKFLHYRVSQAINGASRNCQQIFVLSLDLDRFARINDSLGYAVGDDLLQSVAKRLSGCVRSTDTVSRQRGDQFAVMLSDGGGPQDVAIAASRMLQAVSDVHSIDHYDLRITTSIGVSCYPDDCLSAETLLRNADAAMYKAKENGRNSYQFFGQALRSGSVGHA
jgi:diguanylate cyclase (GGDEF)-like protein